MRYQDANTLCAPKTNQHCRAVGCLASIWNDLPQEFIDEAILSFRKRLRSCVAAAGGHYEHSVNTERASVIHYWNVWSVDEKVVQSLICYYWICRTRMHVHLKKRTLQQGLF